MEKLADITTFETLCNGNEVRSVTNGYWGLTGKIAAKKGAVAGRQLLGILQGAGLKGIGMARFLKALAAAGVGKGNLVGNLADLLEPTKLQERLVSGGLNNATEILSRLEEIGALKEERAAGTLESKKKREDKKTSKLVEDAAYKHAMSLLTYKLQEFEEQLEGCTNTADVQPLYGYFSREFYYYLNEYDIANDMDNGLPVHGRFIPAVKKGLLKAARELDLKAEKLGKAKYKELLNIQNFMWEKGYRQTKSGKWTR